MLLKSYRERMDRAQEKKTMILHFLREETWTHCSMIQALLQVNYLAAHRTLQQLQRDGFVRAECFQLIGGKLTLWGITPHGLAIAADDKNQNYRAYFERSKVSLTTIYHTLDIQLAEIKARQAGWTEWVNGKYLKGAFDKRPDAVAKNPQGQKIAIEVERTIKTKKRYEQIMSYYLQAIKKGDYDGVLYLAPKEIVQALENLFRQVVEVPVNGARITVSEIHHQKFDFFSLNNFIKLSI